jgi:hypothetical protein
VAVASSLFSMQGVLPFTPNLVHFAYVLLLLIILVAATLVVLFNWDACLQPIVLSLRKVILYLVFEGKRVGIEIAHDIGLTGKAVRRAVFSRQGRRAENLENGLDMV